MATHSNLIVHHNEKRHKCHFCGAVRYESFMRKLEHSEIDGNYYFGNDMKMWTCKNPFDRELHKMAPRQKKSN